MSDTITINGGTYHKLNSKLGRAKKGDTTLAVHMVLDRSGSMQFCRDDTIGAFNTYVETLAKETPNAVLTLTLFDTQAIEDVYTAKPITKVEKLTSDTFIPRASTPLYDAVGRSIGSLSAVKADRKALVILTDGQENASREWTADKVKALLTEKQEKDGWLVIYLGANQDAFAEGNRFGTRSANTMPYDTKNMRRTLTSAARATGSYMAATSAVEGQRRAGFTEEERAKAVDADDKA
jgi:hypothetical protein